jgi:transcriptional regulator with XRE-family HTH domain
MSYKDQIMRQGAILAHQLKAARTLAKLEQQELSTRSGVSVSTIKRMEAGDGSVRGNYDNVAAVVAALEAAGVEFTNGDQPGVRLKASTAKSIPVDGLNASTDE